MSQGPATRRHAATASSIALQMFSRARRRAPRRGFALPLALLLCLALGAIAAGAATQSFLGTRVAVSHEAFQRALAAAEAGLDHGVELLASSYEAGASPADSTVLVAAADLKGFTYSVTAEMRREPAELDLNGNGVTGEVVRYSRAWGYAEAAAAGTPGDEGEPVWRVASTSTAPAAGEEVVLGMAFERDPGVADPGARGAWRPIPLRWSSFDERP